MVGRANPGRAIGGANLSSSLNVLLLPQKALTTRTNNKNRYGGANQTVMCPAHCSCRGLNCRLGIQTIVQHFSDVPFLGKGLQSFVTYSAGTTSPSRSHELRLGGRT